MARRYATEGTISALQNDDAKKIWEVTPFPEMFLQGRHTATFLQRNEQSVIHRNLCLKQLLE
jgi:hypothetical protein